MKINEFYIKIVQQNKTFTPILTQFTLRINLNFVNYKIKRVGFYSTLIDLDYIAFIKKENNKKNPFYI